MKIPFNKPFMTGKEFDYIRLAHENAHLAGDGPFTSKCHRWIEQNMSTKTALLTHSCTAALEMCALLVDIQPGDEVIMPSYTFVSTANAFALRGGVPVFVDIRQDTLNLDESLIEDAITARTKAILPVHYAGVACEMDTIMRIAKKHELLVIEDAAQGVMASYKGRALGSIGDLGTYSFHETKNVISGEGGALAVNRADLISEAEIIREKGTDRSRFLRGSVDKYTWQSLGSSFLPGEIIAAFLWAQLQEAQEITDKRCHLWNRYYDLFENLENQGLVTRPHVPEQCEHNAHMFYLILAPQISRKELLDFMATKGVNAVFHYVPLHTSPAGHKFSRHSGNLTNTVNLSEKLIRLPLWIGLNSAQQQIIYDSVFEGLNKQ